jgi:hypothetical protein
LARVRSTIVDAPFSASVEFTLYLAAVLKEVVLMVPFHICTRGKSQNALIDKKESVSLNLDEVNVGSHEQYRRLSEGRSMVGFLGLCGLLEVSRSQRNA